MGDWTLKEMIEGINPKDELKRLAENATPGPWYRAVNDSDSMLTIYNQICETNAGANVYAETFVTDADDVNNTQYVAAANPATVLKLLEEIALLRASLQEIRYETSDVEVDLIALKTLTEADKIWSE